MEYFYFLADKNSVRDDGEEDYGDLYARLVTFKVNRVRKSGRSVLSKFQIPRQKLSFPSSYFTNLFTV